MPEPLVLQKLLTADSAAAMVENGQDEVGGTSPPLRKLSPCGLRPICWPHMTSMDRPNSRSRTSPQPLAGEVPDDRDHGQREHQH